MDARPRKYRISPQRLALRGLALPLAVLCPVQALVYLRRVRKNEKALIEMVSRKD